MSQVIHLPYGQEHPYEQGPEERFPREPLAGESFTVGIVTRPPSAIQRVRVHTLVNNEPGQTFDAVPLRNWQPTIEEGVGAEYLERMVRIDQDVWQAQLSAPSIGHTLTYWIEADGIIGPRYSLTGKAWRAGVIPPLPLHEIAPGTYSTRIGFGTAQQNDHPPVASLPALRTIEWLTDGDRADRVRLVFDCLADERFFGLGERFNALDQRGQVLDVRCFEQYKNQGKRTYMPIPFLLSSAGYGLYVQSNRWMQFDLAASQADRWVLEADLGPEETLDLTWFTGEDPFAITGRFTQMTGPAVLPPLWSFGLWMSANEWNSQPRVEREVQTSLDHEIFPSVVVIEAWSDETTFYIWNDAQYTPTTGQDALCYTDFTFPAEGKWPNPKAMIDRLHERNIRLVLWQIPTLKRADAPHAQHDADRAYFEQAGLGVREPDGSLYQVRPFWFRGGYLWDVTNPVANAWWMNKRAYLLDEMGVDGFKTDGGEHLWGAQTQFADGRTGEELWNVYPQLYTEVYYRFMTGRRADTMLFSRAGFVGSQRSPAHWAGDENSTWDAYRHSIFAGLSAGISGIPFWGWDIAGFSGEIPSAELYLRAAAMAAFCPIMQYHAEYNQHRIPSHDRTPWNIQDRTGDERVIPVFRFWVNVRHNLMPYIWQEAQYAANTGQPMMRAAYLTDHQASPYQYFFGRDLLVSPVVDEGATQWPVYLPQGNWVDFWTRESYAGQQVIPYAVPLDRIPVFVRAGSQIPVRWGADKQLGEFVPLSATANGVLGF